MHRGKILIAGAGIAGPALAFWLNAAGFETTLAERAPALRAGGYVIDFWGVGYEIAKRMGLASDLEAVGYHIREMRVVDGDGQHIAGFGERIFDALTGGAFVTLRRSDLSRALFDRASRSSETIFGDELVGLQDQGDSVRVQFARAGERRFDLVIGADGLHSKVRELMFGPEPQFEKPLGYVVATFETEGYRPRDDNVYVIYNEPGLMLGRVALRDDRTLFLFVFSAAGESALVAHEPAAQKAVLRQRFGAGRWECREILAQLDEAPELYYDRVSQIHMRSWSRGRVALLGDAAFCVSLMAGQGSALAIVAAYVLAGELGRAGGRHDEAFRNYETRLRPFIASKQKAAERFSAAFAPKTDLGLLARNLVVRACALPGVARLAFGREMTDAFRLPDYAWPHLREAEVPERARAAAGS